MDIIDNQDLAGANNAAELPILISSICDELIERLERVWRLPSNSALIRLSKEMLPHLRAIRRATKRKINHEPDSLRFVQDFDVLTAEVAKWFRVEVEQLRGGDRKAHISMARQIAFSLARSITGAPFTAIGKYYNNRHHASIMYGCNLIAARINKSPQFKCRIATLRGKIEAQLRT